MDVTKEIVDLANYEIILFCLTMIWLLNYKCIHYDAFNIISNSYVYFMLILYLLYSQTSIYIYLLNNLFGFQQNIMGFLWLLTFGESPAKIPRVYTNGVQESTVR